MNSFKDGHLAYYKYHARHSDLGDGFLILKNSLEHGLKSICFMGAKMYNDLPEKLKKFTF